MFESRDLLCRILPSCLTFARANCACKLSITWGMNLTICLKDREWVSITGDKLAKDKQNIELYLKLPIYLLEIGNCMGIKFKLKIGSGCDKK